MISFLRLYSLLLPGERFRLHASFRSGRLATEMRPTCPWTHEFLFVMVMSRVGLLPGSREGSSLGSPPGLAIVCEAVERLQLVIQ